MYSELFFNDYYRSEAARFGTQIENNFFLLQKLVQTVY